MSNKAQSFLGKLWDHFRATWPLYAASTVTIGFGNWTYSLAFQELSSADGKVSNRWEQFMAGQPNTMGDTLAGFVGSLTLIWVVASVIQQSMELKAQRKEFSEMALAQAAQVKALDIQISILQDEKRRRDESESDKEFEALVNVVMEIAKSDDFSGLTYVLKKSPTPEGLERCEFPVFQNPAALRSPTELAKCVREVVWSVGVEMHNSVQAHKANGYSLEENLRLLFELRAFRNALAEIEGKISHVSAAGKVKARSIDAIAAVRSLDAVLSDLFPLESTVEEAQA